MYIYYTIEIENVILAIDIVEAELGNFAEKTPAQSNTFNRTEG